MLSPRLGWLQDKVLNYSQIALFERSPQEYANQYIYNEKQRITRNMQYGTQLADGLEVDEATGDPLLDFMASMLPKYELMDIPIFAELENGKEKIKLRGRPDSAKKDYSSFYEYKTSTRPWTQKMVDQSGQITFYATVIWLKTKKIPQDIELICIGTRYQDDGSLTVSGDMVRVPTKRTMMDIIKMCSRIRKAYAGIKKLCEKELL